MDDGITNHLGSPPVNLIQQGKPGLAIRQGDDGVAASFAQDSIDFPITQPFFLFNDRRTLINTHAFRQLTAPIIAAIAFSAFLLATQVFVQITTSAFVCQNILIDSLVADPNTCVPLQQSSSLFRAPILSQLVLDKHPGSLGYSGLGFPTSAQRYVVSLFGTIAALASVPLQLSADRGFVYTDDTGYLRLIMAHFQQRINLVSLFMGKLCVVHKRSFDLAVSRGLYYLSLPLSTIKVALVS
jgi:hypothetical protein